MKSRAAVLVAPEQIELRQLDVPRALPDGCCLVRVEGSGMCGTDVHQFRGRTGAGGMAPPFPVVLGHEPVGHLELVSPVVQSVWGLNPGDRVAVEPTSSCGTCQACASGRRQHCPLRRAYSLISTEEAPGLWGSHAEYLVVQPGTIIHRMPESVPIEDAVFFNPLAAAYSWLVEDAGARPGEDVLLIGPGQRGLASVIAARELGARRIIVAGRESNRAKFDLARQLGATHVLEDIDVAEEVLAITGGEGVHRAIDFTPAADALLLAIAAARTGGSVLYVARHGDLTLPADEILRKALSLRTTTGCSTGSYARAIHTLSRGTYDLSAVHTHRFGLDDVAQAIRVLGGDVPGEDAIHITITATS